ncbi:UNVERIFIED_ORG: polar amino acid transport system permease protein [Kosakonia oryzae]|uniref:Polar amino acid transport system permease protein n=1 Tax=Kosakonia radicincitans TaxID=283686 RepID=A0AAX2EYP4_9ENTR|nr:MULTISPECIES: amino acid ABC transporter permease [Kosakonia]MDP9568968.1 polar amino acid transport system permease protein [Kosakonia oryzae]PTA88054.1 amino acid ABC transporter permease [Kosakonia sp. H7A]SFF34528.1 polar amino acid transport system permease protein [Kosakonia radicincitans]SFR25518.1 polar amino acid transport system permease protein [Kosakonia radicincitans]SFU14245.1 polar amino acid transport system permease protein [Kosakonia radicincitans]
MGLDQQVLTALPELGRGLLMTLLLTVLASLVSVVMGQLGCFLQLRRAWIWRTFGRLYVSLMRGTPAIVQLFVVFFTLPKLGLGGQPLLAAVLAIGLNSGAYVAEILRVNRGLVTPGQLEAARTLGLSRLLTWWYVINPQVLRASLPMLVNEFTILLKTTPLASVVALTELTFAGQIVIARTYEATQVLLLVAAGYLLIALPLTTLARRLEAKRRPA